MKKRINILIFSIIILISLTLYYIKNNNVVSIKNIETTKGVEEVQNLHNSISKNYKKEKINKNSVEKTTTEKFNIVKQIGDVEQKYIDEAETELLRLPRNFVETFEENGWEICITTENIAQVYCGGKYGNSVSGVTIYSKKKILIEDRDGIIKDTLIHELGHYLDYINNFPSQTNEFKQIYDEEVNTFKSNISNPGCVFEERELFAEIFYYLIVEPTKCTPRALEFVQTIYET